MSRLRCFFSTFIRDLDRSHLLLHGFLDGVNNFLRREIPQSLGHLRSLQYLFHSTFLIRYLVIKNRFFSDAQVLAANGAIAESPDGLIVVSAGADETLRFWNVLGHLAYFFYVGSYATMSQTQRMLLHQLKHNSA
ncbi:hypothetical protein V8G54_000870 [Vigna mungo]|uniref:Uncharacterized protein n=1 Tax=Vigna mungo TaxID=3915 RepID=A0AAQ3P790_VIGMU